MWAILSTPSWVSLEELWSTSLHDDVRWPHSYLQDIQRSWWSISPPPPVLERGDEVFLPKCCVWFPPGSVASVSAVVLNVCRFVQSRFLLAPPPNQSLLLIVV